MKAFTPHTIMVKVTVNDDLAQTLRNLGFNHRRRMQQKPTEKKEERHLAAAEQRGVDPMRFAQGAGGRNVPDSGTPVFGRQGQNKVSLAHVVGDIKREFPNFALVGLNVQTKPDGRHVLWQVYTTPEPYDTVVTPDSREEFYLQGIAHKIYNNCYVWRNPVEGTVTVNVGSPLDDNTADAKDLRIFEEARSIRCVER